MLLIIFNSGGIVGIDKTYCVRSKIVGVSTCQKRSFSLSFCRSLYLWQAVHVKFLEVTRHSNNIYYQKGFLWW